MCRGSLRRLGQEQLAIGQLHWSTANYQPLQERALWDGLVRMHGEVSPQLEFRLMFDFCAQAKGQALHLTYGA